MDCLDGFERTKKTQKTRVKASQEERKLDMIMRMIQDMNKDLKTEILQIRKDQKEYTEEIKKLKEENPILKKENMEIREDMVDIKRNLEWIEKDRRRNNIVITGLEIDTRATEDVKKENRKFYRNKPRSKSTSGRSNQVR